METPKPKEKKVFLALVGVAASGKTELAMHLCQNHGFFYIKSLTTRLQRPDQHSDYNHVSVGQFKAYIRNKELLEYTFFGGNYYGKLKKDVEFAVQNYHSIYLITADRIKKLRKFYQNVKIIYITPPEPVIKISEIRMRNRGYHSEEVILKKLKTVREELILISSLKKQNIFDYEIVTIDDNRNHAIKMIEDIFIENKRF